MLDSTIKSKNILHQNEFKVLSVRAEVLYSNAMKKIVEFSNDEKVDMIVIGNLGLSGLSTLKALGSVSRGIS